MMEAVSLVFGMMLGAFSGLVPGIHSNTVASVLSALPIPPEAFAFLVVAVFGSHLVFQFFPSIFLSIPDDTVVASVLPGHRMALEGRGREALMVCAFAVTLSALFSALLLPLSLVLLPIAFGAIQPHLALVLAAAALFLLFSEKEMKKIALSALVFLLSGALGIATLRGPINDPLFPSFSGLFAASGILLSFTSITSIPRQKSESTRIDFLPYIAAGVVLGMLSDLLPGIAAPAQIAIFASAFLAIDEAKKFLALVSSIAASHAVFAFGALLSIGKAREGSLAILNEVSPVLPSGLPSLIGALLISIGISAFLLMRLSRHLGRLQGIDARKISLMVLGYLAVAVAIISGGAGLVVFATATAIGLLPPLLGIRRTHVMGLIIVPSILLSLQAG